MLTFVIEMRATIIFIFLCSLFFLNGTHAVSNKAHFKSECQCSSHNQNLEQALSLNHLTDSNRIIEESDLDSTEESNSNLNLEKPNKIVLLSHALVNQWEKDFLGLVIFKNNFQGIKDFKPCLNYSQPLYILQRVLRI